MPRKRHTPEQIIRKLREAEVGGGVLRFGLEGGGRGEKPIHLEVGAGQIGLNQASKRCRVVANWLLVMKKGSTHLR